MKKKFINFTIKKRVSGLKNNKNEYLDQLKNKWNQNNKKTTTIGEIKEKKRGLNKTTINLELCLDKIEEFDEWSEFD